VRIKFLAQETTDAFGGDRYACQVSTDHGSDILHESIAPLKVAR